MFGPKSKTKVFSQDLAYLGQWIMKNWKLSELNWVSNNHGYDILAERRATNKYASTIT